MKPVDAVQFRMFLVPTMLFVGSLVTSLTALPLVSVSTTVIFRAMTTCGVAVGDILIFGKRFSVAELLCLVAVVIGAAVYAGLPPARNQTSRLTSAFQRKSSRSRDLCWGRAVQRTTSLST